LSGLDELGEFFKDLTSSSVNGRKNFFEFDGNVGSVAIQYGAISVLDLSWMVQDNNLSQEVLTFSCRVVLGVRAYITSFNVLD